MSEERQEQWQTVVMHLVIAVLAAANGLRFLGEVPGWLTVVAVCAGATGGLLFATRAWTVHRIHRPSLPRGLAEFAGIIVIIATIVRALDPVVQHEAWVGVLLAIPAWFAAYALYMLLDAVAVGHRQPSRF